MSLARSLAFLVMIFLAPAALADPFARGQGYPLTIRQIHSGHSLTDNAMFAGDWPGHGIGLLTALGAPRNAIGASTIPGSPMRWRRTHAPGYGAPDAWNQIGDWQLLVVTENNLTHPEILFPGGWEADGRRERREELRLWRDNAWQNGDRGRGAPLVYYTNWPDHNDYPPALSWRDRLAANEVEWQARIEHAEAMGDPMAPKIRVVPGNALMMRIHDDAEMGLVPGLPSGAAFLNARGGWWKDSVHPGPYLSLALAYLHVAVIHGIDPTRLPHTGLGLDREPDRALAFYLKATARDIARLYSRVGG
jgi:hypothetical protein